MMTGNFEKNVKSIEGSFAVEGMSISDDTKAYLKRMASGKATCSEIIEELKAKYMQRV